MKKTTFNLRALVVPMLLTSLMASAGCVTEHRGHHPDGDRIAERHEERREEPRGEVRVEIRREGDRREGDRRDEDRDRR